MLSNSFIQELLSGLTPVGVGFVFGFCLTYLISRNIKNDHY